MAVHRASELHLPSRLEHIVQKKIEPESENPLMKAAIRRAILASLLFVCTIATSLIASTTVQARPVAYRTTVALPNVVAPIDVAVNKRSKLYYLADQRNSTITVVHSVYGRIVGAPIFVPGGVNKLAINPNTYELAVSSTDGYEISIINLSTRDIKTVAVTHKVTDMAFNTVKNELWFSGLSSGLVSVINMNASPRAVSATLYAGAWPQRLAIDEKANRIYVNNSGGDAISAIDGATRTVAGTVRSTGAFGEISVDSESHNVYVAEYVYGQSTLSVFDGLTGIPIKRNVTLPGKTTVAILDIAIDQVTKKLFAVDNSNRLLSWDATTGAFESFNFDGRVNSLAIDQVNGEVSVFGKQPSYLTGSYLKLLEQGPLAPEITSAEPPVARVNESYSFFITSASFFPDNYQITYAVTSGRLPWGLGLDPDTGEIHGTPLPSIGPVVWNFTVSATNVFGSTSASYKMALVAP